MITGRRRYLVAACPSKTACGAMPADHETFRQWRVMALTWWDKQVFEEMETVVKTYGINTFKHFMAYKGALMVNDKRRPLLFWGRLKGIAYQGIFRLDKAAVKPQRRPE